MVRPNGPIGKGKRVSKKLYTEGRILIRNVEGNQDFSVASETNLQANRPEVDI